MGRIVDLLEGWAAVQRDLESRSRGGRGSGQEFGVRTQGDAEGAEFTQPRGKKVLGGHLVALL